MLDNDVVRRMRLLIKELRNYNHLYYVLGESAVADEEYDQLRIALVTLENEHPNEIQPDSPILSIGGISSRFGETKKHSVPMLSLGNAMTTGELEEFVDSVLVKSNELEHSPSFIMEYKFDGLAVSLIYEFGKLTLALTRGDGTTGEVVTDRVLQISNVPTVIDSLNNVPVFEVRGEVIMPKAGFDKYNKFALENGERVFANPRNAAAGSLRQRSLDKPRPLAFYAYSINQGISVNVTTQSAALDYLENIGFSIGPYIVVTTHNQASEYTGTINLVRDTLPYEIDGIVIKLNSFADQAKLGTRARDPRWAIAFKFPAKIAITTLDGVTWQVGRMGQITPVGHVTPIHVSGVVISNVTLHNPMEIERLDLRLNDKVTIQRAGDVIPKITKVWTKLREDNVVPIIVPTTCPTCHSQLHREEGEIMLFCDAGFRCESQFIGCLAHFASREGMAIDGLAEATVVKLAKHGLLSTPADLYTLRDKFDQMRNDAGIGVKTIANLLVSIDKSKHVTLQRFIHALSIPNVGHGTSTRLERHYPDIHALLATTKDELLRIDDIGDLTASKIYQYITNFDNILVINALLHNGVEITNGSLNADGSSTASNEKWVITGSFDKPRHDIIAILNSRGITVTNSVNAKTDCLLVGGEDTGSSKYKKAVKLGIPIVTQF